MFNSQRRSHTLCQVALSYPTILNLTKSMSCLPTEKMKIEVNLKDEKVGTVGRQSLTQVIPHLLFSAILKSQSKNVTLECNEN